MATGGDLRGSEGLGGRGVVEGGDPAGVPPVRG